MPTLTVKIDASLCIAAANCVGSAPHIFQIDEAGIAELVESGQPLGQSHTLNVSDEDAALIDEAAQSCPTGAIQVVRGE